MCFSENLSAMEQSVYVYKQGRIFFICVTII